MNAINTADIIAADFRINVIGDINEKNDDGEAAIVAIRACAVHEESQDDGDNCMSRVFIYADGSAICISEGGWYVAESRDSRWCPRDW